MSAENFRIGIGYDLHQLTEGRKLIIGGVEIPYKKGLLGHSDADVLIHAIIDALLGAAGLPDIGTLFPDTDNSYKDADSTLLLKNVYNRLKDLGYSIINIDTNIIAQAPKMMTYIPKMKEVLVPILGTTNIAIKAKTKEHLDSVGEGKAIEAQAVVLLTK